MNLVVKLNGTSVNPYHKLGLKRNPFPQQFKAGHVAAVLKIQELAADPIPDIDYIRSVLKGFSEEFVELCCTMFEPGEMVTFKVHWDDIST